MKPGTWTVAIPGRVTGWIVFSCLFLLCWIAGLAVGATLGLRALMQRPEWRHLDPALGLRLFAWAASGVAAMALLRRCLEIGFGKEGLVFQPGRLTVHRVLWGGGARRDYDLARVEGFVAGRSLRFRYGRRWVGIGASLTDAEIAWLEGELNRILKEIPRSGR